MRGGVSVRVCAWRGVSEGVCVEGCQWGCVRGGVSVRVCAWRGVSEDVLVHSVDWCVATVRAQRCHVPVMFLSCSCHVPP